MDVSLNSDQFFGFYPVLQGGVGMAKDIKFTFYGIMWSGGTVQHGVIGLNLVLE